MPLAFSICEVSVASGHKFKKVQDCFKGSKQSMLSCEKKPATKNSNQVCLAKENFTLNRDKIN